MLVQSCDLKTNTEAMRSLDEAATIFLGIGRLRGVGFKTLRELGGVDAVAKEFTADPHEFVERITHESQPRDVKDKILRAGEEAANKVSELGIGIVRLGDAHYPAKFNDLEEKSRPLWFFYRGNIDLLTQATVAVVGTRSPTPTGEFLARYAISAIKELSAPVVSGLARGIDEIAHEWAITCGLPNISVLGNGLLKTYPPKNLGLANKIVTSGGLLLSEYMPTAQPTGENFVWRNRLQAALANCVVAPEWKRSSGTAHTIRFAKRMGRLTINLQLTGGRILEDHGEGDLLFEVPLRHTAFVEALQSTGIAIQGHAATNEGTANKNVPMQGALF